VSPLPPEPEAQSVWALGNSYAAAAHVLMHGGKANTFRPTLFLLLHALELYLKAFLFSRNVSEKELKNIRHDLVACMRACRTHNLSKLIFLPRRTIIQVVRINRYYREKELEYFTPRARRFGSLDDLAETVAKVAAAVFEPISEGTFRALSKPATLPGAQANLREKPRSPVSLNVRHQGTGS